MTFRRVAIVNRGEPAMRLINGVVEYNAEHGTDLQTIALYTDPDRDALFVREADEAFDLGAPFFEDENGARQVRYLDYGRLEEALVETRAEAVWVGWGFVAEHARFVDLCDRLGVVFIGPSAEVMRRLGDKITSKQIAESAGVPVAPWSGEPVETADEAHAHAERLGYPVMIKATAGGGGRGIRKVLDAESMPAAFEAARSEALGGFGDATVFVESLVAGARHIEVQIIGDDSGTVWAVGVRDCSVQRRNQKILEEAPSPALTAEEHEEVLAAAARLGKAAGYRNAGTVEFLYEDGPDGGFSFMEVNARLQVEHPVTEVTTGVDMVKLQLHVARGGRLEGDAPATTGYAIEARLNAEDPDLDFAPAPGRLELLQLPVGPGVRVDTGVAEGDSIAAEFDSMIAKIIAVGGSRDEALARLRRALRQMQVAVRDGTTNKAFLLDLLSRPEVVSGDVDVGWVDRMDLLASTETGGEGPGIALVTAAIWGARARQREAEASFLASSARGRPEVDDECGDTVALQYRGERYSLQVARLDETTFRVTEGDDVVEVIVERAGRAGLRVGCAGRTHRVVVAESAGVLRIDVDGTAHRVVQDDGGVVRAPSPAVVVRIDVVPGDEVERGTPLATIEAMKMETAIVADYAGVVREVLVGENVQVAPGTPLLVIDRAAEGEESDSTGRVDLTGLTCAADVASARDVLTDLRRALLGYDVVGERISAIPEYSAGDDPGRSRLERDILAIFTDILALYRRDPHEDEPVEVRRSSEEYLFAYLRNLDAKASGLPELFVDQLRRSLAHYGIDELEPTPDLRRALHRIAKAHARIDVGAAAVQKLLEFRIDAVPDADDAEYRTALEALIDETRGRLPALHDLARELHYRAYDVPFLDRLRADAHHEADRILEDLESDPARPDRDDLIQSLVDINYPLKPLLSPRFVSASESARSTMLEVITRRYYRVRHLENLQSTTRSGHTVVTAEYDWDDSRVHLFSTHVDLDGLEDGATAVDELLAQVPPEHEVVVDFYAWRSRLADAETMRQQVIETLNGALGHRRLRRIVVAISGPERAWTMADVVNLTLRPDGEGGYCEEALYSDLHPMMAKRLELWRFDEFDLDRIPTSPDIYLFHAVARENKRDERLFALAEVRDLTPVLDDVGHVVRLPELERVFHDAVGPMRRFQAARPGHRRLSWNRVILNVWPRIELPLEELRPLIERLAPDTEGLGLQRVQVRARLQGDDGKPERRVIELSKPSGLGTRLRLRKQKERPIRPMRPFDQIVSRLRQRGLVHPYEIVDLVAPAKRVVLPAGSTGSFAEHDLVDGPLVPVERSRGENTANVIVGIITNNTDRYPDGMARVAIFGDPTRGMGNLAEAECARIIAALELAEARSLPVEWYAVSAGARISMESGTENMDWIGRVLRSLVEFTQAGGEVNIIVTGVNVGAQPYWNAEATMLMHTRGVLIMLPQSAMVLTGKEALDYSGGVSAEDNQGIGGYERIMGPNGQAQYFAHDLANACEILLRHYEHTYVAPGERFPRPAATTDATDRNIEESPHGGDFDTVGEVFAEATNPGRKRPFDMRQVMSAVIDYDHAPLERWFGMEDAEIAIIWDAHIGGTPISLIGLESRPIPRLGLVPADGPDQWTAGTLFPRSSKKIARAINAASGNRPLVVLANLSGFDGSPESLRSWQLEYGAEIGRAVVNFEGPIVFVVVSRYHGGAFVVFSNTLNDNMEVVALEGSKASVIGGAPAAAVVFARDVNDRVRHDPRIDQLETRIGDADDPRVRSELQRELETVRATVRAEHLGAVADEFDGIHTVERALEQGSIHGIIAAAELRPYLVDALARGMARASSASS